MPTDGPAVFNALQSGLHDADQYVGRCDREAADLDRQIQELLARRGEVMLDLARHFLPEVSRPAIEATFSGIRGDLLNILARKEQRQRELQTQLDQADAAARAHDAEIDDVTAQLNAKVAERERLEAQVAETLKHHAEFQERSKLLLVEEEQLHRNEQRVAEIQKDAAEKLPHYDRSRLFRYLYDRGYGTPDYKAKGLILELDRWVARLIKFNEAKGSYDFLKRTPALVTAEVDRRKANFQELMRQVETIQKAEADRAGLTAVLQEGDQLGTRRDELVRQLEGVRRQAEQLQHGLAEIGQRQNAFYGEAIERFRRFLGETRVALLEQRARQSPSPDDDAIVAEIARLDAQIDGLKPHVVELADRRGAAERVRNGLDQVVRRFRGANYDSQRSYFDDAFDIRGALGQFQAGMIDVETLWSTLEAAQRFQPHWVEQQSADFGGAVIDAVNSPAGRVILGAVIGATHAALRDAALRGVHRREEMNFPPPPLPYPDDYAAPSMPAPYDEGPPSMPAPEVSSYDSGPPPAAPSEGGFTSGEGF